MSILTKRLKDFKRNFLTQRSEIPRLVNSPIFRKKGMLMDYDFYEKL